MLTLQLENQRIFLKEKLIVILSHLKRLVVPSVKVLRARFVHWTKPLTSTLLLGTLADLGRSKAELVAENALLRQQLIILQRVLNQYVTYFNHARPHQGIHQQVPEPNSASHSTCQARNKVIVIPILGGLHHDYQRAA